MEEPQQDAPLSNDRPQKTGKLLRALREGIGDRTELHKRCLTDLEAVVNERILQLAEAISREHQADSQAGSRQYEGELDRLRTALAEREESLAESRRRMGELQQASEQKCAEFAETLAILTEAQEKSCPECAELQSTYEAAQERESAYQREISELKQLAGQAHTEISAAQEREEELSARLSELESAHAEAVSDSDDTRKAAEQLRVELESQIRILQQQLTESQEESSRLTAQLAEQESLLNTAVAENGETCEVARQTRLQLEEQIEALEKQLSEAHQQEERLSTRVVELENHQKQAASEQEEARQSAEQLRVQLEEHGESLEKQLADARLQEERFSARVAELESIQKQAASEHEKAYQSAEQLRLQQEEQIRSLAQQLADAQQHEQQLANRIQGLESSQTSSSAEIDQERLSWHETRTQLERELQGLQQQLTQTQSQLSEAAERFEQGRHQQETLAAELAATQAERVADTETHQDECSRLHTELSAAEELTTELAAEKDSLAQRLAEAEQALQTALRQSEQLSASLRDVEGEVSGLREQQSRPDEVASLTSALEQAKAEVHRLATETEHLQEELVSGVQTREELVSSCTAIQAERDSLAARIAELEAQPVEPGDDATGEKLAEMQRRYELAMEDLRDLKRENAELQNQLQHLPQPAASSAEGQPSDWQSLKARLLASLESEDDDSLSPQRVQERAKIEDTISATERVVAEKDRQIESLRGQLASQSHPTNEEELAVRAAQEVLNTDELIQAERTKLEQLQAEWRDKLRTAELELSVQRATLARKEAEIENRLAAMAVPAPKPLPATEEKPRRRWLSALGLKDEEKS